MAKKIILDEKQISELEQRINALPLFARNVTENMAIASSIQGLIQWLGEKIIEEQPKQEENEY